MMKFFEVGVIKMIGKKLNDMPLGIEDFKELIDSDSYFVENFGYTKAQSIKSEK